MYRFNANSKPTKTALVNSYLLLVPCVLFLIFYLILSYHNRPASDDILFIALIKKNGYFNTLAEVYKTWSGRWASFGFLFFILSVIKKFENIHYVFFIYHIITITIFVYSVSTIVRKLIYYGFSHDLSPFKSTVFSVLFIAVFYFSTFNHIEVWWWVSATTNYLQGIVLLLFGIAINLKNRKTIWHYILISISFLYVGASFEIYIIVIFSFIFIGFLFYYSSLHKLYTSTYQKGVLISLICFLSSAIVCFGSPGNYKRKILYNDLMDASVFSFSSFIELKYLLSILIASLFIVLGLELSKSGKKFSFRKALLILIISFTTSIIILYLFQLFVLNGKPVPLRGCTFTSFLFSIFLCLLFLFLGYLMDYSKKRVLLLNYTLPLILSVLFVYISIKQYKYVSKYSKIYDQLIADLVDSKGKCKVYYYKPLPDSGMLVYLYLDSYTAVPLKEILNLDFEIKKFPLQNSVK